jgi:type I restriction enzyme M protein
MKKKRINESNLQNQVWLHFYAQVEKIGTIDSQKTDNDRIHNLLNGASKTGGNGLGRPEHIITINKYLNLVLITELKGDTSLHGDDKDDLNKVKYAIDGVKHYSNALSKEFDVISIAISGDSIENSKITHFYQPKKSAQPIKILGNKLLDIQSYIEFYTKNEVVISQDYEKLRNYANELNLMLHSNKILESQRSLLLSAILMGLDVDDFKETYQFISDPSKLSKFLHSNVCDYIKKESGLSNDKIDFVNSQFNFILNDVSLCTKENVLKNIILNIDKNIKSFVDTYKYRDVLGEIYNVFLSYSNSDKGLGIVLTPPHITELACELTQVNSKSIVLDNCTGTSGFLISSMKYMVEDCKGDEQKIKYVKENQLIGVEYQSHIYALAVCNFIIHKSFPKNILSGSCFDEKIIDEVREKKPNIGFLNPPYKSDKKNDIEELEFVLNNLNNLQIGGKCVALLPMSCAVRGDKKIQFLKEKILESHTLEGVLSMPDELFYNSNAGVVSCLMIFTSNIPHNFEKEVFFGYYKDDGFVKRKNLGRVDYFNRWGKIKNNWINNFLNKKEEKGVSVKKCITKNSEWSVEKYLVTDYESYTKDFFENELHDYSAYLFKSKILNGVTSEKLLEDNMLLFEKRWELYKLTDIFTITGTKTTKPDLIKDFEFGPYPYVTTQASNNGVEKFTNYFTELGGVLTIDSAVLGYTSYQKDNFLASDHVEKLTPKFDFNIFSMFFLKTILNYEQYRFNYGRKASQTRLKELNIFLPTNDRGEIDVEFMENFIKTCNYSFNLKNI